MANYGLSYPTIAKLDVSTGKYSDGFKCGKAVNTDVNPNYIEASLYGDNELAEYAKEFKDADVTATVTTLPFVAAKTVFGHKINEETKSIEYYANDEANFVGYGFYANEMVNNVKSYVAVVLLKVKFAEAAESYTTKGENLEFKTPNIAGKAYPVDGGKWRDKQIFETEEDAQKWINEKLGITTSTDTEGTDDTGEPETTA